MQMPRLLTVAVVGAVAAIAALAALDAVLGGSSSSKDDGESASREATVTRPLEFGPPPPSWQGIHRRTVRLEPVLAGLWTEVRALDPGSYAVSVRIEMPHGGDVDVWFEDSTGARTIDLLGRSHHGDCRELNGRDVCVSRIDIHQDAPEVWTLIARTSPRRLVASVMRLRVAFRKTGSA